MSVKLMSLVFEADIPDLPYVKDSEKRNAKASTVKLLLLAYADHANDEGEAAYPGYNLLERKTALSRQGIADTLEAVQQNGYMTFVGKSKRDTNSYQINVAKLAERVKPLDSRENTGVKPLDQSESSHLTTTSQATGLNPSLIHPLTEQGGARRTSAKKRGDIFDMMADMAQSPGMKKALRIEALEGKISVRLGIRATSKKWQEFLAFADARQEQDGQTLDAFLDWLIAQPRFDASYWPPEKMQQHWGRAFLTEQQPESPAYRLVVAQQDTTQYGLPSRIVKL